MEASSLDIELSVYADYLASLTLELTTDEVETSEEVPAYSLLQLAGKINGNFGMYFGSALFHLQYSRYGTIILYTICKCYKNYFG